MLNLTNRRQKQLLALSLLLAAGFYLAVVVWSGYATFLQTLQRISVLDWLFLLMCSICNYTLRFVRWHRYARLLGCRVRRGIHWLYYMAGFALTMTPAKAGETLRSFYLKQHGLAYHQSIAMFVTERFLDVLVIAGLASLNLFQFSDYQYFVILACVAIIGLLLLVKSPLFRYLLEWLVQAAPGQRLPRLAGHLLGLLQSAQRLLGYRHLPMGLLLGVLAWGIQGLAFYYILQRVGFDISLATAMGIYAISLLAGAATFIPGGVGGTEVVMGLLLVAIGADTGLAVAAPLISRFATLWFAVLLGFIANAIISRLDEPIPQ